MLIFLMNINVEIKLNVENKLKNIQKMLRIIDQKNKKWYNLN